MIYQTRKAIYDLAVLQLGVGNDLRDYKTIRLGDWKEVPVAEQPSLSIEWGGNLSVEEHTNPFEVDFDIHLVTKCSAPLDPDDAEKLAELLLWSLNDTSDWGLIPFLRDNRKIQIANTPFTVLLTIRDSETVIEGTPEHSYSCSCITVVNCKTMR